MAYPTYNPFELPYPELQMPTYQPYGAMYPTLGGPLYGQTQDVIGRLLRGEIAELPIEDIMGAYRTEQQRALGEYMPKLRESWAERGLLRSGMASGQELESAAKASEAIATTRAGLAKESALLKQQAIMGAVGPAMQMTQMQYGAQQSAYNAARDEYTKAYQAAVDAGGTNYQASQDAYNAAYTEFTRRRSEQMEIWRVEFEGQMQRRGYSAQQSAALWQAVGNILGMAAFGLLI